MYGRKSEICSYIENVLDVALSSEASVIQQSYAVLEKQEEPSGFLFVPRYPSVLILNSDLYFKVFEIVSSAVYPLYTCVRPNSMQLVKIDNESKEMARGFFFPWYKGKHERYFGSVNSIIRDHDLSLSIPIMKGMNVNRNATTWIISGNTGSGKSYALRYLEEVFCRTSNKSHNVSSILVLIDPKKSDGARFAKKHKEIELIVPDISDRPEDFLIKVNAKLSKIIDILYYRQNELFENSTKISTDANEIDVPPIWIIIEEMASLTLGLPSNSRQIKDLYRQLELIALLGREALIGLVITTQIARNDIIPIPIRSQMNVRILLGRIDSESVQYLFPSITNGINMPIGGKGSGIIEINDGEHFGVEPVEMPTIIEV